MDWHIAVGIIAGLISAGAIVPYVRDALAGKTKPNVVSWSIWTVAVLTVLFAQMASGASWSMFMLIGATVANVSVLYICWRGYGYHAFGMIDRVCLFLATAALVSWYFTSNPLWGMVLALTADGIAYIPTYAKVYREPRSELPLFWGLLVFGNILALLSVTIPTPANVMFPIVYAGLNTCVLALAFVGSRRR
jgi:hypothetical protein